MRGSAVVVDEEPPSDLVQGHFGRIPIAVDDFDIRVSKDVRRKRILLFGGKAHEVRFRHLAAEIRVWEAQETASLSEEPNLRRLGRHHRVDEGRHLLDKAVFMKFRQVGELPLCLLYAHVRKRARNEDSGNHESDAKQDAK